MNINLHPFPILTTERLTLRKLNEKDADAIFRLRSDNIVNAYLDREPAASIQDAKNFIQKIESILQNQQGVYWAIALNTNDTLIGTICYYNFDLENNVAEIGYELSPVYHGQGIMQEAIEKVIRYGFEVMQLNSITAFPRMDNENSIKLLKRNRFELDEAVEDNYAVYVLKRA
ncbi:GNAT family N-acetyltransferase [Mucilaginibacter jinjuensis]|uniref:GNAT family N-acetyltransferase n=1 Tax=Mucilaginibacter jinjuensis TaxID=1176721 RepID=A0ABY7T4P3_9SPHI|nr:GNAT family N-acetyltransferase [Mucilaginibacter jinjuensis]WCT11341.1 GNAT family N-acetyltransferase [Mucilaginibacter jinjuensis]